MGKTKGKIRKRLILASGSPRRQAFFRDLGLNFTVQVAEIDESPKEGEAPEALARRLAQTKAAKVGQQLHDSDDLILVVAADTVVALEHEILGKPADEAEATSMLQRLRNRVHVVITGLSVFDQTTRQQRTVINRTEVRMRAYSESDIAAYVASGDPMDKAGAYAIQHPEFAPVTSIEGCLSSVMGLPLGDLCHLLVEFGLPCERLVIPICEAHSSFHCCQRACIGQP